MAIFPGRPAIAYRKRPAVVVTTPITQPSTGATAFPNGPGGGSVGDTLFILQGQSNAVFFADAYDQPEGYQTLWRCMDAIRAMSGLTQQQSKEYAGRWDLGSPYSLYSGSATYHNTSGGDPKWLDPVGHTLSDPTTWANTDIMTQFLAFCASKQSLIGTTRPIVLLRMHNEYDSRLGSSEIAVYEAANKEFIRRYRAVMGARSSALLPVFLCGVAYDSGTNDNALRTIRNAWRSTSLDAANNVFLGHGSAMDADDRGDGSHWNVDAADRVSRRISLRVARWLYDNGYTANDLSWLPRLGPTITGIARVSGQANKLDFTVTHDALADDLVAPAGTPNYGDFVVKDGTASVSVTGLARQSATVIRATMASNISADGTVTLDYGARTPFNGLASQFTDNWHLKTKPALINAWPDLQNSRMILNRFGGLVTLGISNAVSGGTSNPNPVVDPATQTLSISPNDPGTRDAGAQTMTITSANLTSISWTRVSGPPNYAFLGGAVDDGNWTDVATTGSITITPNWTATGQFIKYWPTGNINAYKDSLPVTINAAASVPAAAGSDRAFAHDFVKGLTIGVNIERDNTAMVTNAWLDDLLAAGCTHVRLFPFSNATLGFKNSAQMGNHYDAVNRILAKGMRAVLDLQDVTDIGAMNNGGTQSYIIQCCADITARGWDPSKVAIGHTNEMANAGNETFNAINTTLLNLMRSKLPASMILVHGAGNWSSPDTLTDGSLQVSADKRRIYQWHTYEWDRSNIAAWAARRDQVKAWAAAAGVETINGEFGGFDQNFNDQAYSTYPAVIDAFAKGAGNCGGTIWAVTNGSGWRLNVSGSDGTLRSEVKTALTSANAYIRAQTYFNT